MVTPDRRRVAVQRVQQRFGVSERRACAVVGQPRSTQRRAKASTDDAEARLREHLRDFARCYPRLGWRKAYVVAHREGLVTNPKRTRRVWRDERLQRPPQRRAKRRRLADGTAARLRAQRPNDVWALDFQFDETAGLRRVKLLNIVDEFTREALCVEAAHSIDADGVAAAVERLIAQRGAPADLRMDNGPELVSAALRDWCRIWGTHTALWVPIIRSWGADQGFRAPSWDQESVHDAVHEDSASARIAAGQRPRPSFRHPQDFNAGSSVGRRWAEPLAASGQLHGRHWAGSHGRRQCFTNSSAKVSNIISILTCRSDKSDDDRPQRLRCES